MELLRMQRGICMLGEFFLFIFIQKTYIQWGYSFLQGWKRLKQNRLLEKGTAVAAMLLCVSVSFIPGLMSSVGRAVMLEDRVEVTVQVCGVSGCVTHVVSLTKHQQQCVESYLLGVQERLTLTENREEMRLVLKEAVGKLASYGLFSGGIGAREAERLVAGVYLEPLQSSNRDLDWVMRWNQKNQGLLNNVPINTFCLLFAVARKIEGYVPSPVIVPFGTLLILGLVPAFFASLFGLKELANKLAELGLYVWMLNPFRWFNIVLCEGYETEVRSVGLKGLAHVTFPEKGLFSGFTGLMIAPFAERTFFLGTAFGVYDLS